MMRKLMIAAGLLVCTTTLATAGPRYELRTTGFGSRHMSYVLIPSDDDRRESTRYALTGDDDRNAGARDRVMSISMGGSRQLPVVVQRD